LPFCFKGKGEPAAKSYKFKAQKELNQGYTWLMTKKC